MIFPAAPGDVTVTFTATAETPDAGIPPRPVTFTRTVPHGPTAAAPAAPVPLRVSNCRNGANDTNAPGSVGGVPPPTALIEGGGPETAAFAGTADVPAPKISNAAAAKEVAALGRIKRDAKPKFCGY